MTEGLHHLVCRFRNGAVFTCLIILCMTTCPWTAISASLPFLDDDTDMSSVLADIPADFRLGDASLADFAAIPFFDKESATDLIA